MTSRTRNAGMLFNTLVLLATLSITIVAQQLTLPRPSPLATVSQTIGITDVSVRYSRPGVKGRTIWGDLVPYDKMWRTGANDATLLTCSDTIRIGGVKIPAGTYSIATIPSKQEWIFIVNKNKELAVVGNSNYKQEDDLVRVSVQPTTGAMIERMRFTFEDVTENSALLVLAWEKLRVAVKIETDVRAQTMAKIRSVVNWSAPNSAANYFLQQNSDLDYAMKLVDLSLGIQENYWNLRVMAQLLAKANQKSVAITTMEKAIKLGEQMKDAPFDFAQMKKTLEDWKK